MDRIASLLKSARDLRRKLFASMPWGYRVAHLYLVLASAMAAAFGKTLYAMFLQRGVAGMPDVHGQPAAEWFTALPAAIQKNLDAITRKLPADYGSVFGHKLQKLALLIVKRPDKVDDALQKLMEYLLTGGIAHLHEGSNLKQAENFITKAVQNRAFNVQKEKARETGRGQSMTVNDDEGGSVQLDISDTNMMKELEEAFPVRKLLGQAKTKTVMRAVHPDALTFVELVLQGYDVKEIVGDPKTGVESMLPTFNATGQAGYNFIKTYIPKIHEALIKLVQDEQT